MKRTINNFLLARKKSHARIDESDGPFLYEYIAVSEVIGAKLPPHSPDIQIKTPNPNAFAYLTSDWESPFFHIDRSNSIATLLLTAFFGTRRFIKLSRHFDSLLQWIFGQEWLFMRNLGLQVLKTKNLRLKGQPKADCYLIYKAQGHIKQPLDFSSTRKFSKIGVALDAINTTALREEIRLHARRVTIATSLTMSENNASPDIRFLSENIHLKGANDLVIYVRNFKVWGAGIALKNITHNDVAPSIEKYISDLELHKKLFPALSLFALSQHKSNDNLRSFIASWSALELLINYLGKRYWEKFQEILKSSVNTLPPWDRDLENIDSRDYRLRDRFYLVACTINLNEAKSDSQKFNDINSKRSDYYHQVKIADSDLPTYDVQSLFRKYLKIALSESKID